MTQIILNNLDPAVVAKLQALAQQHGRSLEAELKAILEQVTQQDNEVQVPQRRTREELRKRFEQIQQQYRQEGRFFSDSVELLREDRQR